MISRNLLSLCEEMESTRKQELTQYADCGNSRIPTSKTVPTLEAGMYNISMDFNGNSVFSKKDVGGDEILRFDDERQNLILEEVSKFWNLKDKYNQFGFVHSRGIMLYGPPGSGKSVIVSMVCEQVVKSNNIAFFCRDPSTVLNGLKKFREVEPERFCVVVLEDLDELLYNEQILLNLLDGQDRIGNVLYLGTTNFLNRIPSRLLRPPRFDRKILVGYPPIEGRMAYLSSKLSGKVDEETIKKIADNTKDFSFGHLRELIVSCFILGNDVDDTIERLKNTGSVNNQNSWSEAKLDESLKCVTKSSKILSLLE